MQAGRWVWVCLGWWMMLACVFSASPATPERGESAYAWQETVDRLATLQQAQQLPAHLREMDGALTGEEFDVSAYFDVLTHLAPEPGYVLDYVYVYDFMGGYPLLYARAADARRYPTASAYTQSQEGGRSQWGDAYLDHLRLDGTPEAYEERFTFSAEPPHQLLSHERKELVPYDCGIMF